MALSTESGMIARRRFLQFLAGSPLLAHASVFERGDTSYLDPDLQYILSLPRETIASPGDALNVFDFEAVARNKLPPAHYGYIAGGVTDESTQIANRMGFRKIQLRMRRLMNVVNTDTTTSLLGVNWPSPLGIAPCGHLRAFNPEAEVAVARAARTGGALQILSNVASMPVEEVNRARGEPVWFQLYTYPDFDGIQSMVKRADNAGCPVLVITVDRTGSEKRETLARFKRIDTRDCKACHGPDGVPGSNPNMADYERGQGLQGTRRLDWDLVNRIGDLTRMKIVIKGIVTAEDARLCSQHEIDGIIVSNHGGREESSNRATIDSLREVVDAVGGKIPVMMDGGIRRGVDIFKALAVGASKVFIGRPYLWGLGAFGEEGVAQVLDILNAELQVVMKQAGVNGIDKIDRDYLVG